MRILHCLLGRLLAVITAAALAACGGDGPGDAAGTTPTLPGQPVAVGDALALTALGTLISFNRDTPGTLVSRVTVLGLLSDEALLGMDLRPADGKLYALSSRARIYTLDPSTGLATLKAVMETAIGDNAPFTQLKGQQFGVGFDAAADRLRVVSDTGQNLHVNVDTGSTVTDASINGASAAIKAIAHTNALPGTVSARLFGIDGGAGTIYRQDPPNEGSLNPVASLGFVPGAVNGFSIDARTNVAYAALTVDGSSRLHTVPLDEGGVAVDLGPIGGGEALLSLALTQPTQVHVVALHADGMALSLFDAASPTILISTTPITGLDGGETVLGVDHRPADRQLYALTSSARIIVLDTGSGAASLVSTLAPDPADNSQPYAGLVGSRFSVDFDPVEDRLRVISDSGANLRINVEAGSVVTDADLVGGSGERVVVAAAHGNNHAGASSTVLYDLATNNEALAEQSPANDGTLIDIGPLGFELAPGAAMDIAGGDNGLVLVAGQFAPDTPWVLFTLSLTPGDTGLANLYRNPLRDNYAASLIGGTSGPVIMDIAIQPL